jgi:hypothetical protein
MPSYTWRSVTATRPVRTRAASRRPVCPIDGGFSAGLSDGAAPLVPVSNELDYLFRLRRDGCYGCSGGMDGGPSDRTRGQSGHSKEVLHDPGFVFAGTELIVAQSTSIPIALTFSIVSLSGLGLATANYWALTQTLIPASAIRRVSGIQNCAASVAGIVAPIFTGWLKQHTGSYRAPMFACSAFLVCGVLSYLLMVKRRYAPQP